MQNNNYFGDWRTEYTEHPQADILKKHVERSIQDLFLKALRSQNETFIYIFNNEEKINVFCDRMTEYWVTEEVYEKCAEIVILKESLINKLATIEKKPVDGTLLREWLKSSF